ncbi:TetR/AcrR family transcriptional regulator [Flexibacterium corallicola]|uniref:TetR/AcrR family transcriptional regulator n=1 Tax=Flexibacterium corallicola TaxID=3037259 RepID=UPI00286ED859|nr:TetR/AcrR family transcriptional regulator [Pseudovibrio sp. M1P-2-3]
MKNAEETRARLMTTAISAIWQSNYCGVGVNEICQQAGVTKGAFYHHFNSKAELYLAATRHYWQETRQELEEVAASSLTAMEHLDNYLQYLLDKQSTLSKENDEEIAGCPYFTSGGQAGPNEPLVKQAAIEIFEHGLEYTSAMILALKKSGALEGDPDVDQLSRMLQHYIQGLLIYGKIQNSLQVIQNDLKDGAYRIVGLKKELRNLNDI